MTRKEQHKKYYKENKKKCDDITIKYQKSEKGKLTSKLWRQNNKEKLRQANIRSYKKHREIYLQKNREKQKAGKFKMQDLKSKLKRKYGITLEQYEQMFQNQNGLCAICGKTETSKNQYGIIRLSVDHCHNTKKVRGLLCNKCNFILGLCNDSIEILKNSIKYLTERK
jgi:hypothetical protein